MTIFKSLLSLAASMAAEAKMSLAEFEGLVVGRDVPVDQKEARRVLDARRAKENAAKKAALLAAEKAKIAERHSRRDSKRAARRMERAQEIIASRSELATADALSAEGQVEALEDILDQSAELSALMGEHKFRSAFGPAVKRTKALLRAWNRNCGREVARLGAWLSPDAAERVYNTLLRREEERAAAARDYTIPGHAALKGIAALARTVGVRA